MDQGSSKRERLEHEFRGRIEGQFPDMLERALETHKHGILPQTHFQAASVEAKTCYVHGHFFGCIMIIQAVSEGLAKFVAQRNNEPEPYWSDDPCLRRRRQYMSPRERSDFLRTQGHLTLEVHAAFERIHDVFRNSLHHMNRNIPPRYTELQELALQCVEDLYIIESWLFQFDLNEGKLVLKRPQYWDIHPDGKTPVYLDLGG